MALDFSRLFERHPLPWVLYEKSWLEYPVIRDANDMLVLCLDWDEMELLEFIVDAANKRILEDD